MKVLFFFLLFIQQAYSQEGYPSKILTIEHDKSKGGFITNHSCFPVTVFVNGEDLLVKAKSEKSLKADSWGQWFWLPGSIGSMEEKTVPSPLKGKWKPDFGADGGGTHADNYRYSYDFSVPEGTEVYAMAEGIVIRVVQHYTLAHQDKARMKEVNKVEVLHPDGSSAAYVHLKANSVKLKTCEKIKAGQLIGLSGHNGFSSGPHLHVDIIRPIGAGKFHTLPLKFLSN